MRTCLLSLVILIVLLPTRAVLGQPSIAKSDVPSDLPTDLRKLVERLYSSSALERGQAAWDFGEAGAPAARAVPFLISMLPDRDNKITLPSRYVIEPCRSNRKLQGRLGQTGQALRRSILSFTSATLNKDLGYEMTNAGMEAATALGKIGKPAVRPLIQVLANGDARLTVDAAAGSKHHWSAIRNRLLEVDYLVGEGAGSTRTEPMTASSPDGCGVAVALAHSGQRRRRQVRGNVG
jgi:hypothetical protein